jgi:carboxypeptidase Taq
MAHPIDRDWDVFADWVGIVSDLGGTLSMLGWDRETVMPAGAAETRARQMGTLATLHHRETVRADLEEVLARLVADEGLDPLRRRQVEVVRRARERALRTPERLVRALSEARSRSVTTWVAARRSDDWASFAVPFREVVALTREQAAVLTDGGEPYDALLDEYEPDMRVADLEPVFAGLTARLAPLVAEASALARTPLPERTWPAGAQLALARDLALLVGYDLHRGHITTSAHPFTSSPGAGDVRFTTRVTEDEPLGNIMAVMHEAGHALYEQGFPVEYARTPLHDAPSLGAHESQSRFWENHLGRTRAFWNHIEPLLRRRFPEAMRGLDGDDLFRAASAVRPSLIRVDADEVTYNLHIALRFELEVALFRGRLEVDDLPEAWDARMEELLGIRPRRVVDGVMQDIHWPEGLFGYFPTYTIGNLYAARLAEVCEEALGPLEDVVAAGRFEDVLGFMRERVHRHANTTSAADVMRAATGGGLEAEPLIAHLERYVERIRAVG